MPSKLLLSLIATSCLAVAAAFGYALEGQAWPQGSNVTMQLSLGGSQTLIDGFTSFNESAEDGLAQWNKVLDRFQFSVVRSSSVSPRDGDRLNSIFFASTVFGRSFGQSTLAVTLRTYQGSTIVEADVVFNTAKPFNSYRGPLRTASTGGTLHDFHRVVIHEFGHVFGLDHPDTANQNIAAIMNSIEDDTDALQQDDINGGQYLYGGPSATPAPGSAGNLLNLSTRGIVAADPNLLIGGFIVQGSQPTSLVLRALGPSLTAQGVSGALSDPVLELRDASGNQIQINDDWEDDTTTADALRNRQLAPSDSHESALLASVSSGNYTAIVRGYSGATGVGLLELFDLQASDARLGNLATRESVQTGDGVMIAGFIIGGSQTKQVILRAIGPSLSSSGVAGTLSDPVLELHDASGALLAQNDDWRDGPDAAAIQTKGFAPAHDQEAALLSTLNPGNYTAVVRGYQGATGIAVAEVYDLSPAPNQ